MNCNVEIVSNDCWILTHSAAMHKLAVRVWETSTYSVHVICRTHFNSNYILLVVLRCINIWSQCGNKRNYTDHSCALRHTLISCVRLSFICRLSAVTFDAMMCLCVFFIIIVVSSCFFLSFFLCLSLRAHTITMFSVWTTHVCMCDCANSLVSDNDQHRVVVSVCVHNCVYCGVWYEGMIDVDGV